MYVIKWMAPAGAARFVISSVVFVRKQTLGAIGISPYMWFV